MLLQLLLTLHQQSMFASALAVACAHGASRHQMTASEQRCLPLPALRSLLFATLQLQQQWSARASQTRRRQADDSCRIVCVGRGSWRRPSSLQVAKRVASREQQQQQQCAHASRGTTPKWRGLRPLLGEPQAQVQQTQACAHVWVMQATLFCRALLWRWTVTCLPQLGVSGERRQTLWGTPG